MNFTDLKYMFIYMVLTAVLLANPLVDGKLSAQTKAATLRIIYSGGLTGKIEPCG